MSPREARDAEVLELKDDATVVLTFDGGSYRLRRPRLGEWNKLRELLYELQDEPLRLAAAMPSPTGDEEEDRRISVERNRDALARLEDMRLGWIREAAGMLSDQPLPANDDLPAWLADSDVVGELVTHWRKSPIRKP